MAQVTIARLNRCALAAAISLALASGSTAGECSVPDVPPGENRGSGSAAAHPRVAARNEVVFIDRRLPDHRQLLRATSADAEVHYIDGDRSGIEQIALALS